MRLNEAGGDEFGELGFEGGAVDVGEGDGVGDGLVGFEARGELAGEHGSCGRRLEALPETGDSPANAGC